MKKHKAGRVVGRRVNGVEEPVVWQSGLEWLGVKPAVKQRMLDLYGGEDGILQMMRDACPICRAGGEHEYSDEPQVFVEPLHLDLGA
jgi:hypothetical protein